MKILKACDQSAPHLFFVRQLFNSAIKSFQLCSNKKSFPISIHVKKNLDRAVVNDPLIGSVEKKILDQKKAKILCPGCECDPNRDSSMSQKNFFSVSLSPLTRDSFSFEEFFCMKGSLVGLY